MYAPQERIFNSDVTDLIDSLMSLDKDSREYAEISTSITLDYGTRLGKAALKVIKDYREEKDPIFDKEGERLSEL